MKIAIVDSDSKHAELIKSLLTDVDKIDILGSFKYEQESISQIADLKAEIIIISMHKLDEELPFLFQLKGTIPDIKILVLANCESHENRLKLVHFDINALLGLTPEKYEILHALKEISDSSKKYFTFDALSCIMEDAIVGTSSKNIELTEDEKKLMKELAEGKRDSEIVKSLKIKEKELQKKKDKLFKKMNVEDAVDMIFCGIQHNLLPVE